MHRVRDRAVGSNRIVVVVVRLFLYREECRYVSVRFHLVEEYWVLLGLATSLLSIHHVHLYHL
jgi:hypothetical protein